MAESGTVRKLLQILLKDDIEFLLLLDNPVERKKSGELFTEGYASHGKYRVIPDCVCQLVPTGKLVELGVSVAGVPHIEIFDTVNLDLSDNSAVKEYVYVALQTLRQLPCKALAKMLIRIVEPKKKNKHPYKGGIDSRPPWWPDYVIHKEPDHLPKEARLMLLSHLIITVFPRRYPKKFISRMGMAAVRTLNFHPHSYKYELVKALFEVSLNLRKGQGNVIKLIIPNGLNNGTVKSEQQLPSESADLLSSDGTISLDSSNSSQDGDSSNASSGVSTSASEDGDVPFHLFDYLMGDLPEPLQWSEEDGENTSGEFMISELDRMQ